MGDFTQRTNMPEVLEVPEGWECLTEDKHLIKKIEVEGTGDAPLGGSKVEVHYTGRLVKDGSKFDSSRDRNEPFTFKLAAGQVIKGWDVGVATMKKGERATLRMASDYGYGDSGSGAKIPGGAALEFDVELLDWDNKEDLTHGKKGVMKEILVEGKGYKKPSDCSKVTLALKGMCDGQVVEQYSAEEPLRVVIGEEQLFSGLETAVTSMKPNEKAKFVIRPEYGYDEKACEEKKIPAGATLEYEVELLEMEKEPETWDMSNSEKLEYAKGKQEQGNKFFKEGRLAIAFKRYETGLNAVRYCNDWEEEETKKEAEALKVVLNLNMATVKSKTSEWKDVLKFADEALTLDARNIKALYRKGTALSGKGEWQEAEKVLRTALEVDESNKEVKRELLRIQKKRKERDAKDKRMYQRMFQ